MQLTTSIIISLNFVALTAASAVSFAKADFPAMYHAILGPTGVASWGNLPYWGMYWGPDPKNVCDSNKTTFNVYTNPEVVASIGGAKAEDCAKMAQHLRSFEGSMIFTNFEKTEYLHSNADTYVPDNYYRVMKIGTCNLGISSDLASQAATLGPLDLAHIVERILDLGTKDGYVEGGGELNDCSAANNKGPYMLKWRLW